MAEIIRNDPIAWIFLIGITLTNLGLAWVCMNYAFLARDAARLALRIEDEEDARRTHPHQFAPEATTAPHTGEDHSSATMQSQDT